MTSDRPVRTFIPYDVDTLESDAPTPLKGDEGTIKKFTSRHYPKNAAEKLASEGFTKVAIRETGKRLSSGKIPVKLYDCSIEDVEVPVEKAPEWAVGKAVDGVVTMKKGKAMYDKTVYLKKGTRLLGEE